MGILKTAARAAVASSVHGRVQRRQQSRWAAQDQGGHPAPPGAAPVVTPPAASDLATAPSGVGGQLELLAQLGELRQAGVLTEEEFEAKKAEILGG
jgi:hypothetical protein